MAVSAGSKSRNGWNGAPRSVADQTPLFVYHSRILPAQGERQVSRNALITGLVCVMLVGALATGLRVGEATDMKLLDAQFRLLRAQFPRAAPEVVVVGIDEATAAQLPEPMTLWHPHLAKFLQAMAAAKPAAVGIDLVLPDRGYDRIAPGYDKTLLRGIIEARRELPLVLAITIDPEGKPRPMHAPFAAAAGEGGTGYALLPVDADGVVRQFDEHLGEGGAAVPTLAGQLMRRLGKEPGTGFVDYARGAPFAYVPMHRVLEWYAGGNQVELERTFKGKPVLLGVTMRFIDSQTLPVALAAWKDDARDTPGVLLHAQILRNLLDRGFIQRVPPAVVMLTGVATALLWLFAARALIASLLFLLAAAALLLLSTWLLAEGGFLPVAAPLGVAVLATGGRYAYETILRLRERQRLRGAFSGYVSPPLMEEILAGHLKPHLGGVNQYVCVMFSDIRGYTTRSEGMKPEAIISFLNRYFEEVVRLIHARGGSVVCFMGDGIMAVFGAPKPMANPSAEAFAAARDMVAYIRQFNADALVRGEAPIEIGVGLHAGLAVVGHVGSTLRHDYSAIGDVTNVASRVEGLTKDAGYRLVCTKTVVEQLPEPHLLTALGPMAIKGHTPVEVYGYDKI